MIESLSLAITLGCVVTLVLAAAATATGTFRPASVGGGLVAIELALLVQGVVALVGLVRGHRPAETATFVAYLVFSVAVLPVAAVNVRDGIGRWAGAVVVVALLVQAVVVVRMQTSWRSA